MLKKSRIKISAHVLKILRQYNNEKSRLLKLSIETQLALCQCILAWSRLETTNIHQMDMNRIEQLSHVYNKISWSYVCYYSSLEIPTKFSFCHLFIYADYFNFNLPYKQIKSCDLINRLKAVKLFFTTSIKIASLLLLLLLLLLLSLLLLLLLLLY